MSRPKLELAEDGLPRPLRWRPVFLWASLLVGALTSLGGSILLQQLGATTLSLWPLIASLVIGAVLGILASWLGRFAGVVWGNRILRKARRQLEAQDEEANG